MFYDFLLWLALGAGLRLCVGWLVFRYLHLHLVVPLLLTGPIILGATIAKLLWVLPVPLSLVIGLVLQDAILVRR